MTTKDFPLLTLEEMQATAFRALHARSIRRVGYGRSLAEGQAFFCTVELTGRHTMTVHGGNLRQVMSAACYFIENQNEAPRELTLDGGNAVRVDVTTMGDEPSVMLELPDDTDELLELPEA